MNEQSPDQNNNQDEVRIGVFICDCGSNIAGHLDCSEVTEYVASLPGVAFAKENLYTCSEAGVNEIKNAIQEHALNRVVVASCSPRTHQPLFASSCAEAGLNPYLFEMVNIRDQCSWVHMQEQQNATQKAKELVRMGVAKSAYLEPQEDIQTSLVAKALVIGGGIAGLSAAEALASMGVQVYLVEKEAEFGGLLKSINKLAPYNEKAEDWISSLVDNVTHHSNIRIYKETEVESVGGYIGNYQVDLKTKGGENISENVGCIVVATGAEPLKPHGLFGYDGEKVITQMELESKMAQGTVQAQNIVMIQCVGARCEERTYCSRICCMSAVKNALYLKELNPEANIHILYRDMQMYGTEKEKMLWDARGKGINFEVYDPENPPELSGDKVSFYQNILGRTVELPYDLAVLSTPLVAREDAGKISQMMRVPTDQNNFFLEAHAKLRPLDFAADGIFVCGSARYPATVEEARSQGIGVASRVSTILFKDKLVSSAIVAEIDPQSCIGCLGCIDTCPYQAITYNPEINACEINEVLCKGCGNCAATCPSHSIKLKGYKPDQLFAQIRAAI